MDTISILTETFLSLPDEGLANLEYHLKQGTRILCGSKANLYADGKGGA